MYTFFRQLHNPTGVEHSVYCNFTTAKEKQLIVISVNQLQVFKINENDAQIINENVSKKMHCLECISTFQLFGNVMSVDKVRLQNDVRDSLILGFQEARCSIVKFDPSTYDLKTISIHSYQYKEFKDGYTDLSCCIPIVTCDPENRCAAMLVYNNQISIIPLKRQATADDEFDTEKKDLHQTVFPSYVIDLKNLDEKIMNVIDIKFLHGYYEPTLFILYEPLPTWSGRIAMRRDTCNFAAISINQRQKEHPPIIWCQSSLPFDSHLVVPIPKPIGGILIFAANTLTYANQSVPSLSVAVNNIVSFSTENNYKLLENLALSLDCVNFDFIDIDKLVLSLKGGELYVLTLIVDSMRVVKDFHFEKVAGSVISTCVCICGSNFMFLGSRLGNSMLLKYREKDDMTIDQPQSKKSKIDEYQNEVDNFDLIIYGTTQSTQMISSSIKQYTFEVCDSLLNIGPCGKTILGEPAILSDEFRNRIDPDVELVTSSGYGKNGAVCVLQRTIRPQIVTTFELAGTIDMWTVKSSDTQFSSFLILSREDCSMVLQTGQEILELDKTGFKTDETTIFAGNIGKYIIQVTTSTIQLLIGEKNIQRLPVDMGSPIIQCSVETPYAFILDQDGQILQFTLEDDVNNEYGHLVPGQPIVALSPKIEILCVYKDTSALFQTDIQIKADEPELDVPVVNEKIVPDEEDELLYGNNKHLLNQLGLLKPDAKKNKESKESIIDKPTYWLFLARSDGNVEIFSLPNYKLVFSIENMPIGESILVDCGAPVTDKHSIEVCQNLHLRELLVIGMGPKKNRPYLFVRVDNDLLIYEAFQYTDDINDNRLKLRWRLFHHNLLLRPRSFCNDTGDDDDEDDGQISSDKLKWLRPFSDINGYCGLFVCGPCPYWVFMTGRGQLRFHPMPIDSRITSLAEFHNINCPKGFLYFNRNDELRIAVLPTHLNYDSNWPVRKVLLKATVHHLAYHLDAKLYAVVTSTSEKSSKICRIQNDGEKEFEVPQRDENYVYPTVEKFVLNFYTADNWELIPHTIFNVDEFEHITDCKIVNLKCEGTVSGLKPYVAFCTTAVLGEEVTARGRIVILDVIEVVPEPDKPLTRFKTKIIHDDEQKGPVSCLTSVDGNLMSATGQKIYVWQLVDGELRGLAFIDTTIYIHSLSVIKNLILAADISKSIFLMRYQPEFKVLSVVSRDVGFIETMGCEYLVDNHNLCFICSDMQKNVLVYSFQPEVKESEGGQKLLRRGDLNIGSRVTNFVRVRNRLTDPSLENPLSDSNVSMRHTTYYASLDGSIGCLQPISEKIYRRMLMLHNILTSFLPHYCGLNPKVYRQVQMRENTLMNPCKNIIDGELVWRYIHLNKLEQRELARRIGTSDSQIFSDLTEIDRLTVHF